MKGSCWLFEVLCVVLVTGFKINIASRDGLQLHHERHSSLLLCFGALVESCITASTPSVSLPELKNPEAPLMVAIIELVEFLTYRSKPPILSFKCLLHVLKYNSVPL